MKFQQKEQELLEAVEVKSKYSAEFLKEKFQEGCPLIRFVIASNFNIYVGYCVEHYEVCLLYDLNPVIVHHCNIFYDEKGVCYLYLRSTPSWFKQYYQVLGKTRTKEIIKNKILSFMRIEL